MSRPGDPVFKDKAYSYLNSLLFLKKKVTALTLVNTCPLFNNSTLCDPPSDDRVPHFFIFNTFSLFWIESKHKHFTSRELGWR